MSISNSKDLLDSKYKKRISSFVKNRIKNVDYQDGVRIARQVYPSLKELENNDLFTVDPLNEDDKDIQSIPNIIHKYPQKILVLSTQECPVYCRYCTRKRKTLMYGEQDGLDYDKIQDYLDTHSEIKEVILSGGDPFMLPNARLAEMAMFFLRRKGIHFFRYHTRTPTTLPSRFNEDLFSLLKKLKNEYHQTQAIVLHINHSSELSEESEKIIKRFIEMGYYVYSQSVLLRRINDAPDILADLYLKLKSIGVQPYYLHHIDKVEGANHFLVSIEEGLSIVKKLRELIPPYMMPRYVIDSKQGKTNLFY